LRKIGLVFAGGGGKGAYQVGVWKALWEYGVDRNVQAVSGTSVGALNAVLFAQGNYELAERIWLDISPEKILTPDIKRIILKAGKFLSPLILKQLAQIYEGVLGHGWFSRDGLLEIIENDVDFSMLGNKDLPIFATCLSRLWLKTKYFQLNKLSKAEQVSVLLATSAIPFLFDPVLINGKQYWDGGLPVVGDNVPVRPLYEEGCDLIIVVHLDRAELVDHGNFPKARIVEIVPQEYQGGFIRGTLDFTKDGAERRMEQGYQDAKRILQPIFQMAIVQGKYADGLDKLQQTEKNFRRDREGLMGERDSIKDEIAHLLGKR
jgi:NTE family protein